MARARQGLGQIYAAVGEPGVGKSRLVHEFVQASRTDGWSVIKGTCLSHGARTSYFPISELLKSYFDLADSEEPKVIRERVLAKVMQLDDALLDAIPAFLSLLNVPVESPDWQALETERRRILTHDAVKRLLLSESQRQPVLVVIEDLHWIDSGSRALLDSLFECVPRARMLIVVNYRPDFSHPWGSRSYYSQRRIDPLSDDSLEEFLKELIGDDSTLDDFRKLLVERTGGVPFFLEECVRDYVEKGVIVMQHTYVLAQPLAGLDVPAKIESVLSARFDRLAPEDKAILQSAAVIGSTFPLSVLTKISKALREEVRARLAGLQAGEFIYETQYYPVHEFTFKHALTHKVVYDSLLAERRRQLHAEILDAIEEVFAGQLTEFAERLAEHAESGRVWNKAVVYLRLSGQKAVLRSANAEATRLYERALGILRKLPKDTQALELAVDLRCDLRNSLELGEPRRIIDYLGEAERTAGELGDQMRLGKVASYMTHALWVAGEPRKAIDYGARAIELGQSLGDRSIEITSGYHLGLAHIDLGNHPEANQVLEKVINALEGHLRYERFGLNVPPSVLARSYLTRSLAEVGEFEAGMKRGQECLAMAEDLDQPYARAFAHLGLGHLMVISGDYPEAIEQLKRSHALFIESRTGVMPPVVQAFLGHAYGLSGDHEKSVQLLEMAVRETREMLIMSQQPLRMIFLSEAYLRADRLEDARHLVEEALKLAAEQEEEASMAYALHHRGQLRAADPAADICAAIADCESSLAIAEKLQLRPLAGRCRDSIARARRMSPAL